MYHKIEKNIADVIFLNLKSSAKSFKKSNKHNLLYKGLGHKHKLYAHLVARLEVSQSWIILHMNIMVLTLKYITHQNIC